MGRVLIVNHDGDSREALEVIACLWSYEVATAGNAFEGLEATLARIRSAGCDLVLVKPIDHCALERTLADACARAASEIPRP